MNDIFSLKKPENQKKIILLEKISKSGYESLSKDEKEILFKESKKKSFFLILFSFLIV